MMILDLDPIVRQLDDLTATICHHLVFALDQNLWSGYRNFYGDSFSLLMLGHKGQLTESRRQALLDNYARKDFQDSQFHWEFNNYAFSCFEANQKDDFSFWRKPLRFKNTPCTNWTALRTNVKIRMATDDAAAALEELLELLNHRQLPSGLILDDQGVKSFQYHCFSAAMLGEIFQMTGDERVRLNWIRAVEFVIYFIMPHGDANFIGRGQAQSFGHASLVYLLSLYIEIEGRYDLLTTLEKIISYLSDHLVTYTTGDFAGITSLPLVLNGKEGIPPYRHSMTSEEYLGWYPYNNFFDYLPFSGVFLEKALLRIRQWPKTAVKKDIQYPMNYQDGDFIVQHTPLYSAVVSRPGGYWTNDLLFPLIYCAKEKKYLTPLHGGEQFQQSLHQLIDLPSPQWKKFSFRWRCRSLLIGDTVLLFSIFGMAIYRYQFSPQSITIREYIFSFLPFKGTMAIADTWSKIDDEQTLFRMASWQLRSKNPLVALRTVFHALGKSTLYRAGRFNRYIFGRME